MRACRNIKKNHFIGPLLIVAQRQFNRIAHIAKFTRFGFPKLDAAGDFAIMYVQTGNDTFCNHPPIETAVAS